MPNLLIYQAAYRLNQDVHTLHHTVQNTDNSLKVCPFKYRPIWAKCIPLKRACASQKL